MCSELKHTAEALLNPFFIALIAVVLALIFGWHVRKIRWLLGFFLLIMLVFSTGFLPRLLTQTLESIYPPITIVDVSVKQIVVLSGGQADGEDKPAEMRLYSASIKRLLTAIRLSHDLPQPALILSGGGYAQQTPEAKQLQTLALLCAVKPNRIVLETQSKNTAQQAKALKDRLGRTPFYLVTSAIHMPRSMLLLKRQGLNPIAVPTDFNYYWQDERWQKRWIPNAHNLYYTEIVLHEILGFIYASIWNKPQTES